MGNNRLIQHFKANSLCPLGYLRVIGSIQPIYATLGQDIILPCHLQPSLNAEWLTIEWSKPDLQPNLSDPSSHIEYVHVYRGQREVQDMMIRSYIRRTKLFKDELKHGNISLKISNVTVEDGGRYKCYIPKLDSQDIVQLIVGECFTFTDMTCPCF